MLITLQLIKSEHPCDDACKMYPEFIRDYPNGVELSVLMDRADLDRPDQMEWLCKHFGEHMEPRDFSGYCFPCKCVLVRYRPDFKEYIGFEALTAKQQRLVKVYMLSAA